jgi:hypothetical protein
MRGIHGTTLVLTDLTKIDGCQIGIHFCIGLRDIASLKGAELSSGTRIAV